MAYTNSSLVSYTKLSPNHSGHRTHSIDRITPHCVVGQCSVETLGNIFTPTSRQAMEESECMLRRRTAVGVRPPMQMTKGPSQLSVHPIRNIHIL